MDRSGKAFHVKYSGDWRKMSQDSNKAMIKVKPSFETGEIVFSYKYLYINLLKNKFMKKE